jgi:hypothetical protein
MVARVGRFGLVSLTVKQRKLLPRRSITRKILSQANESLDLQVRLFEEEKSRPVTELAYFGCLIAIPSERDPSVPAELCLGIPNVGISHWIAWIPLDRLHGMLQSRADGAAGAFGVLSGEMPDLAFPTFRVPKQRSDAEDEGAE